MVINEKPTVIKIPRLLSDVTVLNNNMPPTSPRNNANVPCITESKGTPGVISGKKTPESNEKITTK